MKLSPTVPRLLPCFAIFWAVSGCFAAVFAQAPENSLFTDIPADSAFFLPVSFLKSNDLISGYSDGSFHPERTVTRAEALAIILKMSEKDAAKESGDLEKNIAPEGELIIQLPTKSSLIVQDSETGEKITVTGMQQVRISADKSPARVRFMKKKRKKPFQDVTEKDWYFEAAAEGKRRGIVKGSSGGKYLRPNDPVNLAEILRMIFVSEGIRTELSEAPLPPDVPEGAWYAKDVAHAVSIGMASQQEDGRIFPPSSTLNRGQLSLLLYRFLQSRNNVSFGYASWYGDGLAKTTVPNGQEYVDQHLTAAHKTLPFGTIVRATNMNSGKSVLVVINDRGPFVTGRIIDLSKSAFSAIENPGTGVVSVQLEVVESP